MVLDAVGQGQGVANGRFNGTASTAAAALLVGHSNGALEHGPRVAIRRVKEVKHLACEVQRTSLVEVLGVVGADVSLALALPRGNDFVVRFGGRREVIRAVDALLVEVHVHLRLPASIKGRAGLRLPLGLPGQIAVHVEQIVVGTSSRPGLVVFPSLRVGVGTWTIGLVLKVHVPIPAIGIHTGVHHHDGAVEQMGMGGCERFNGGHGCLGADRFVAVDVVAEVDPHHAVSAVHTFFHASHVVRTKRFKVGHVGRGGHDQSQQGASFGGGAVLLKLPVRHDFRHVLHIVHHGVVPCKGLTQRVTKDGGGGSLGQG